MAGSTGVMGIGGAGEGTGGGLVGIGGGLVVDTGKGGNVGIGGGLVGIGGGGGGGIGGGGGGGTGGGIVVIPEGVGATVVSYSCRALSLIQGMNLDTSS